MIREARLSMSHLQGGVPYFLQLGALDVFRSLSCMQNLPVRTNDMMSHLLSHRVMILSLNRDDQLSDGLSTIPNAGWSQKEKAFFARGALCRKSDN